MSSPTEAAGANHFTPDSGNPLATAPRQAWMPPVMLKTLRKPARSRMAAPARLRTPAAQ